MRIENFIPILSLALGAQAQLSTTSTVIRTETRTVLVDAVVTDKNGKSIRDLVAKDFHVWEDNREQTIQSAAFVADPASNPDSQQSYLVLFFDNSTLDYASQGRARDAAVQFIEANAGPNRMMAIANYGGTLSITQNFTSDVDRLKRMVADVHAGTTAQGATATGGRGGVAAVANGFGGEGLLMALRRLAANLSPVPGRKTVILFSAGFPFTPTLEATLDSAVLMSNRSNAAVYPVDVTGLLSPNYASAPTDTPFPAAGSRGRTGRGRTATDQSSAAAAAVQQVLYELATRTGGFVYANANSPLAGLLTIGKEQTEYYLLSYIPRESPEGSCHSLRVKTDRAGAAVRARASYCNVKSLDLLSGKPVEKNLESSLADDQPGKIAASMQAPFFYADTGKARIDVVVEIPADSAQFEKVKGKLHAAMNILGIAYLSDGTVGARFSDTVNLDFTTQKEVDAFHRQALHYEKQFFAAPGKYELKVAFGFGGNDVGKLAVPLAIDPYDGAQFMLSGLALSKEIHPAADSDTVQDAELLEGLTPLLFNGLRIVPTGFHRFTTTGTAAIYAEVYDPLLKEATPPAVQVIAKVIDRNSGEVKSTGVSNGDPAAAAGGIMMPFGLKLKVDGLTPGSYRVELQAMDSAGKTMTRSVDFDMQ